MEGGQHLGCRGEGEGEGEEEVREVKVNFPCDEPANKLLTGPVSDGNQNKVHKSMMEART
jgi:hypothetical protein